MANGDVSRRAGVLRVWRVHLRERGTRPRRRATGVLVFETQIERTVAVGRRFGVVRISERRSLSTKASGRFGVGRFCGSCNYIYVYHGVRYLLCIGIKTRVFVFAR